MMKAFTKDDVGIVRWFIGGNDEMDCTRAAMQGVAM